MIPQSNFSRILAEVSLINARYPNQRSAPVAHIFSLSKSSKKEYDLFSSLNRKGSRSQNVKVTQGSWQSRALNRIV